jgi:hypothetical protein
MSLVGLVWFAGRLDWYGLLVGWFGMVFCLVVGWLVWYGWLVGLVWFSGWLVG